MGVYSACISSSVTINKDKVSAAFKALKKNVPKMGIFDSLNIEFCNSLVEILEKLEFEFYMKDDDITDIHYAGGTGDNSILLWPALAPFIQHGSKIVMDHDGEQETIIFEKGDYSSVMEYENFNDEDDYYDENEDEEELSERVNSFFNNLESGRITVTDVEEIFQSEGNLDFVNFNGNTPLIEFLKVDVDYIQNIKDKYQFKKQFKLVTEAILSHNPDLNKINERGETALYIVLSYDDYEMAEKLLSKGGELNVENGANLFECAAERLSLPLVKYLTEKGFLFNVHGKESLIKACACHDFEEDKLPFIKYLVEELGADINMHSSVYVYSWMGELKPKATPLMAAALTDDIKVVSYLLKQGADMYAKDSSGNTALHYCSGQTWIAGDGDVAWSPRTENLEVIKLLAKDINLISLKNNKGKSPYRLAKQDNPDALTFYRNQLKKNNRAVPIEVSKELSGEVKHTSDDGVGYILNFKNGNLNGTQQFMIRNDQLLAAVEYKDGKAHGKYLVWGDDKILGFEANLKEGEWHGEVKYLSPEGIAYKHLNYKNKKLHGKQILLNDDGEIILEANFEDGKKQGRYYVRDKNGTIAFDERFENNILLGKNTANNTSHNSGLQKERQANRFTEKFLKPDDNLFFHKQSKVFALLEKTQEYLLNIN